MNKIWMWLQAGGEWFLNLILEDCFQNHLVILPYVWFAIFMKAAAGTLGDVRLLAVQSQYHQAERLLSVVRYLHIIAILGPIVVLTLHLYNLWSDNRVGRRIADKLRVSLFWALIYLPMAAYTFYRWD